MATTGDKELLDGVIIGFRNLINDRYQYAALKERYELPDSLDEQRMTLYRDFFLQQVYPHPERRELLEEAFRSLDDYLTHPDRMMRIGRDRPLRPLRSPYSPPIHAWWNRTGCQSPARQGKRHCSCTGIQHWWAYSLEGHT